MTIFWTTVQEMKKHIIFVGAVFSNRYTHGIFNVYLKKNDTTFFIGMSGYKWWEIIFFVDVEQLLLLLINCAISYTYELCYNTHVPLYQFTYGVTILVCKR